MHGWVAERSLVRRATEAALRAASRCHLARLGRLAPARCQKRILFGLVHQAQATRFGVDHDFRRIRSVADYRRLVPLYTRAELWRAYWQPGEDNGASSVREGHSSLMLRALSSCYRSALRTALALAAEARPGIRLLSGSLLYLSEEGPSSRTERGILSERLPSLIRPYTAASAEIEAERFARLPITVLFGPAERLLLLFENIKKLRGKRNVRDIWPRLSAILYTRRPTAAVTAQLRDEVGEDVLLLEMTGRAEGPIAVADPRLGLARLLFDHGVYFEFVPLDRAEEPRCPRYGIEEIELGVPYELALTSPAGLWACRLGRIVCLERRDPPLVRFLEPAIPQTDAITKRRPARRTDLVLSTFPLPEAHRQNDGNPAAPPENSSHIPWSILADRG